MTRVLVVSNPDVPYADFAAGEILARMQAALKERGSCSLCLTGGSTPKGAYEAMARYSGRSSAEGKREIAWSGLLARTDLYFGDERCVPPDHKDSNFKMANDAFASIPALRFHRMEGERQDREQAALDYESDLPPEIDVLLLGIGEDGHVASIFPGSPLFDEKERRVDVVLDSPKPPPERITITPIVIEKAREIIVLVTGQGKAEPVARALEGALDPRKTPAQLARRGTWILDGPAASLLKNTAP